jgi:large subunit ribosomal protein L5
VGAKEAVADSKLIQGVMETLKKISGQVPVRTLARKSIASFKLRAGMPIGAKVTLRKAAMYDFLDKLINLSLPKVRDFQGVSTQLDGRGNYNLGLKEVTIFPEINFDVAERVHGLNVTIAIAAENDQHAFELLKSFGMPFKR